MKRPPPNGQIVGGGLHNATRRGRDARRRYRPPAGLGGRIERIIRGPLIQTPTASSCGATTARLSANRLTRGRSINYSGVGPVVLLLGDTMLRRLALLTVVLITAGCNSIGEITANLHDGMTENQVTAMIGEGPVSIDESTCGLETPNGAWQCRILNYGRTCNSLTIYLAYNKAKQVWVVNNWHTSVC